jgi:PAS domain S-box-containing protein
MIRRSALSFEDTVRSRLLRLAVLLLLPGLSLAGMVTWQGLDADRAALDSELHHEVNLLGSTVDAQIGQTEARLRVLATSDSLARGDIAGFAPLLSAAGKLGARIVVRNPGGAWVADSARDGHVAVARTPWDMRAHDRPELSWGPDPTGEPTLAVSVPVEAGGRHIYNLTAFLPRAALADLLPARGQIRDGWFATVYDDDLHVVARSLNAARYLGSPAPDDVAQALRLSDPVVTRGESLEQTASMFLVGRSPHYGLPVTVMAPLDRVEAPSRLSLLLLVGVGGVLVALGLLGAVVVSGSISRPIEALAAAARRLGESDTLPPIPGGLIEADEVAHAMSAASATLVERRAALSDLNVTLAARVAERTAELADANRALEEERARLGLVLDHMPVGVLVSHPSGRAMYANHEARRLMGFGDNLEALRGDDLPRLRRNGAPLKLSEAPPALARAGQVIERDVLTAERADGTTVELEVNAGPVFDRDGKVALAVTTMQDISARLAAEEARRRSQRLEAVGQLTGGVAHEFNNLLMAIGGCLDLLSPHVRGDRARNLLENAARAADRGATLTRQLLAFARRQHLQTEPVDLNWLVTSLADLLGTTLGRGIEVKTDLSPDCWPALADATQLELVLLNLAINARDAMSGGGRLVIGTGNARLGPPRRAEEPPEGDYAMLRVADTGSGMSPEVLARAFEPFFTTKQVGQGSGLGLPHVLGVAQQLGGGVMVDSVPGEGTSVSVFLPRASGVPQNLRRTSLLPPRPRALEGLRVLLVDDDVEVREIARAMLEEMGALVVEAPAARDAILMLRTEPDIDLVLADYTMPHMTGVELSQQVAALMPGVPVVLMTGYSATALGDMGPHVRAVLQKPFRAEAMAMVMTEALGGTLPDLMSEALDAVAEEAVLPEDPQAR